MMLSLIELSVLLYLLFVVGVALSVLCADYVPNARASKREAIVLVALIVFVYMLFWLPAVLWQRFCSAREWCDDT